MIWWLTRPRTPVLKVPILNSVRQGSLPSPQWLRWTLSFEVTDHHPPWHLTQQNVSPGTTINGRGVWHVCPNWALVQRGVQKRSWIKDGNHHHSWTEDFSSYRKLADSQRTYFCLPYAQPSRDPWSCIFCRIKAFEERYPQSQVCRQESDVLKRRMLPEEQLVSWNVNLKSPPFCWPERHSTVL